jgi:hypothetical protein
MQQFVSAELVPHHAAALPQIAAPAGAAVTTVRAAAQKIPQANSGQTRRAAMKRCCAWGDRDRQPSAVSHGKARRGISSLGACGP